MAGIYIPGMDAPKDCAACPAVSCYWRCDGKSKHCPIIPVQDHGRLIDADALAAFAESNAEKYPRWRLSGGGVAVICRNTELTPTIIPADRKEGTPCYCDTCANKGTAVCRECKSWEGVPDKYEAEEDAE